MRFVIVFCLFFSFSSFLFSQEKDSVQQVIEANFSKIEIPVLSKSEMYADFDTLSYLLKNVYPHYYIKSQLNATNYDEKLAELRGQISSVQQTNEFIWILHKAMNLFCDGHLSIPHSDYYNAYLKNESLYNNVKLTPENMVCTYKYALYIYDSLNVKIKFGMRFKYIDGKYYTLRAFKYKGQIYPEGLLLKSINGMSVDSLVNCFYTRSTACDYKNKKYISEYFFVSPYFLNKNGHLFVFEDNKGKILKDTFFVDTTVEILKKQGLQNDTPAVFTIYDSILYIRMPQMSGDDNFYIQQIQKLYNAKQIQKIVIDIRGNLGGSDIFWMNILSHIIPDTIRQNVALYAHNTDHRIRDFLIRRNKLRNRTDAIQTEYLPLLNSELIKIYKEEEEILPHENSIRFNGKIVIMQDEYTFSAAGSLVTIAKGKDKITSIGYSMTEIGGRGLAPLLFQLPYTKMLICMPFVIDFSGVNQMSDFLKGIPEIECEQSISTILQKYYSTNPYQLELLLQDECFLKAISL